VQDEVIGDGQKKRSESYEEKPEKGREERVGSKPMEFRDVFADYVVCCFRPGNMSKEECPTPKQKKTLLQHGERKKGRWSCAEANSWGGCY